MEAQLRQNFFTMIFSFLLCKILLKSLERNFFSRIALVYLKSYLLSQEEENKIKDIIYPVYLFIIVQSE